MYIYSERVCTKMKINTLIFSSCWWRRFCPVACLAVCCCTSLGGRCLGSHPVSAQLSFLLDSLCHNSVALQRDTRSAAAAWLLVDLGRPFTLSTRTWLSSSSLLKTKSGCKRGGSRDEAPAGDMEQDTFLQVTFTASLLFNWNNIFPAVGS